jgi:phosphoribosylanthranilate isomerase
MTPVKVCGITRAEDARLAAELGAWAVGFVFWPRSPRYVDPERARAIVASLPPSVTKVGVFVNAAIDDIERIAAHVRLGLVQLHGDETPAVAHGLTRRVLKALTLAACTEDALREWAGVPLLLDAHDPERRGGTGRTLDWRAARAVAAERPVVLAGGLRPENVAEAIAAVAPAAVDVSSGIEREPGVKDAARMCALFEAVRRTREVTR